ncbi:MAG: HEPN domain-containing protein [bacterium]|nr:HEPN domain-containing protein [bacterium]
MTAPKKEVAEWIKIADEDFALAQLLLQRNEFLHAAVFNAHQAVEKYLKAVLVHHGKDIEDKFKTHNLFKLSEYVHGVDPRLDKAILPLLDIVDPEYMDARYPADLPDLTMREMQEVITAATQAVALIKTLL